VGDLISDPGNSAAKNLGVFYNHARVLAGLDSLLSGYFDPEVATRFQVANLRQDQLILLTPSASIATRLRLQAPELLDFLHVSGYRQIHGLEVRVAPLQRNQLEPKVPRESSPAAKEAADLINQLTSTPVKPASGIEG
jgi:hypothetical protein